VFQERTVEFFGIAWLLIKVIFLSTAVYPRVSKHFTRCRVIRDHLPEREIYTLLKQTVNSRKSVKMAVTLA